MTRALLQRAAERAEGRRKWWQAVRLYRGAARTYSRATRPLWGWESGHAGHLADRASECQAAARLTRAGFTVTA